MKIQWNKVTWYSKTIAIMFLIIFPIIGFFFGKKLGEIEGFINAQSSIIPAQSYQISDNSNYHYNDVSSWQIDQSNTGWSILYPGGFDVSDIISKNPIQNWRQGNPSDVGFQPFILKISKLFEPQTNFEGATLTVGISDKPKAVAQCLVYDNNNDKSQNVTSTKTINGIDFTIFPLTDVGAGNIYQTTSYRTIHNGECVAIEYTIHSTNLENYPAEYKLQQFDENKLDNVFNLIISTFKFNK